MGRMVLLVQSKARLHSSELWLALSLSLSVALAGPNHCLLKPSPNPDKITYYCLWELSRVFITLIPERLYKQTQAPLNSHATILSTLSITSQSSFSASLSSGIRVSNPLSLSLSLSLDFKFRSSSIRVSFSANIVRTMHNPGLLWNSTMTMKAPIIVPKPLTSSVAVSPLSLHGLAVSKRRPHLNLNLSLSLSLSLHVRVYFFFSQKTLSFFIVDLFCLSYTFSLFSH